MREKKDEGRGECNRQRGAAEATAVRRVRGGKTKKFIWPVIGRKFFCPYFLPSSLHPLTPPPTSSLHKLYLRFSLLWAQRIRQRKGDEMKDKST